MTAFTPARAASSQPLDVVFFGDSVTLGHGASSPARGFPALLLQRLAAQRSVVEHRMEISAFGGLYTDLLDAHEIVRQESGLIVVEVGAHSVIENQDMPLSAYRRGYGLLLDCLAGSGALIVVGTVPSLNWQPTDPLYVRAERISGIIRDEASSRDIAVADLWDATRGRGDLVSEDALHPNDAGHQVISDLYWQQIATLLDHPRRTSSQGCAYSTSDVVGFLG